MWSLGALLFGHLTRNCRCSHCPGINSNYALHSDGFCASRPPASPLPSPLSTHTQSQTHISRFSLLPPPPPTLLLVNSFGYWSTLDPLWMNLQKYAHSGVERGGGGGKRNAHTRSVSGALSELCTKQSVHVFHSIQSVKCTFTHLCRKIFECSKLSGLEKYFCSCFCNCDTMWKNTNSR